MPTRAGRPRAAALLPAPVPVPGRRVGGARQRRRPAPFRGKGACAPRAIASMRGPATRPALRGCPERGIAWRRGAPRAARQDAAA